MSGPSALKAGPQRPPRAAVSGIARRPLLLSVGLHGLALAGTLAWTMLWWHRLSEPGEPPQVDVVFDGGGAAVTGATAEGPPAPQPLPSALPPPVPLPPAQAPAAAPVQPPPVEPPAPPTPPLPQVAGLTPLPPLPPLQLPPLQPPPAAQPPAPTPPPTFKASLTAPPTPETEVAPEIRLGDGVAGPLAELMNDGGIIRRATAATGNIPPSYPLDAARRGEHGTVTLRLTIGTDGAVLAAAVAKSSGSPRLDRAARDQIDTWHFTPAMRDGKPQIDVIELGVEFVLE